MERVRVLIERVLTDSKLWDLPAEYVDEMVELASELRVPARLDVVKNFVAAYLVVKGLMDISTADRVVASSSKGRRLWQKRISRLLKFLRRV